MRFAGPAVALALGGLLVVIACGGPSSAPTATPPAPPSPVPTVAPTAVPRPTPTATSIPTPPPTVQAAFNATVLAIQSSAPDSLDRVEDLVALGRPAAPLAASLIDSQDVVLRFAALYYFSRLPQAEDIAAVAKGLDDGDLGNRVTAAATLLRLGDRRGLPLITDAAKSGEFLSFSEPPQLLRDYAAEVLEILKPTDTPTPPPSATGASRRGPGLAAPLPVPYRDVTVRRDGETINITVNLQFRGPGALRGRINEWVKTAKQTWNGKHGNACCAINLVINTVIEGPDQPGFSQVKVNVLPPGSRDRAFVNHVGSQVRNDDLTMTIFSKSSGLVFAHELGHMMGLDDEYDTVAAKQGRLVFLPAAQSDIANGLNPSIMATVSIGRDGKVPVIQARGVDAVMNAYNVPPPLPTAVPPTVPPTTPPTITSTITPARDLTGTWRGGINSIGYFEGQAVCQWAGSLQIDFVQNGNSLAGQARIQWQSARPLANVACLLDPEQYQINGTVSSSSVRFQFVGAGGEEFGTVVGSFTTDLMSGTFNGADSGGNAYVQGCFQVSRSSLGALPNCNNPFAR